jgi:hypothetical protein
MLAQRRLAIEPLVFLVAPIHEGLPKWLTL